MCTTESRGRYDSSKLRYPRDPTDGEWDFVEPMIPAGKRGANSVPSRKNCYPLTCCFAVSICVTGMARLPAFTRNCP